MSSAVVFWVQASTCWLFSIVFNFGCCSGCCLKDVTLRFLSSWLYSGCFSALSYHFLSIVFIVSRLKVELLGRGQKSAK